MVVVVIAIWLVGVGRAETFKLWPSGGAVVMGHERHCGQAIRDELRAMIAKAPLLVLTKNNTVLSIVIENWAGHFLEKRCDRSMVDVPPRHRDRPTLHDHISPPLRHISFWDDAVAAGTLVVTIVTNSKALRRPVEVIMIRRKDTDDPCYERWVGIGEVQR